MTSAMRAALAIGLGICMFGCLRAFGPDLRRKGPHASVRSTSDAAVCMSCHESEADALARMRTQPKAEPMSAGPPLVADWMITEERTCVTCHVVRGVDAR